MKITSQRFAFALIEVVIALGIAAYALMGIIGLLSMACSEGRSSMDDTVLVMIVNRAVSDLRQKSFTDLVKSTPANQSISVPGSPFYYDADGMQIVNTGSGITSKAIYCCNETMQTDADTVTSGSAYLLHVKLQVSWPVGAATPANTKTVYVDIAGH
jgi:uncharacterized protein (TIGR02598 family)